MLFMHLTVAQFVRISSERKTFTFGYWNIVAVNNETNSQDTTAEAAPKPIP